MKYQSREVNTTLCQDIISIQFILIFHKNTCCVISTRTMNTAPRNSNRNMCDVGVHGAHGRKCLPSKSTWMYSYIMRYSHFWTQFTNVGITHYIQKVWLWWIQYAFLTWSAVTCIDVTIFGSSLAILAWAIWQEVPPNIYKCHPTWQSQKKMQKLSLYIVTGWLIGYPLSCTDREVGH